MHCNNIPNSYLQFQYKHNLISQVDDYWYVTICLTHKSRWCMQHSKLYWIYLNDKDVSILYVNFQIQLHEKRNVSTIVPMQYSDTQTIHLKIILVLFYHYLLSIPLFVCNINKWWTWACPLELVTKSSTIKLRLS